MAINNPNGLDPNYFKSAANMFNQAGAAAMPSPESRDRAAGRLRESISSQTAGQNQGLRNQFANQGKLGGQLNNAFLLNNQRGQQAYSQGLAQIEDDYQQRRQAGAGILNNTGLGFGSLGRDYGDQALKGTELSQDYDIKSQQLALDDFFKRGQLKEGQDRLTLEELLGNLESGDKRYGIDQVSEASDFGNRVQLLKAMMEGGLTTGPPTDRGDLFNTQFQTLVGSLLGGEDTLGELDYSSWLSSNLAKPTFQGGAS